MSTGVVTAPQGPAVGAGQEVDDIVRHGKFSTIEENPDALVRQARLRVTPVPGSAVVVQGNLDLDGLRLRVQTAVDIGPNPEELVRTRLADRLAHFLAAGTSGYPGMLGNAAQTWQPPRDFSFGTGQRQARHPEIRRRKIVRLRHETADDAAFFMDAMDYDFHLFFCVDTWQDSMVFRCGPTGYRVAPLSLRDGLPQRRALPITVSPRPAPRLTQQEALMRLRRTEMPFVFFADAGADRPCGSVLYQRYDGHYGLISEVGSAPGVSLLPPPGGATARRR